MSAPNSELIARLHDRFFEERPGTAARALEEIDGAEAVRIIAERPAALAADVLRRVNPDVAARILTELETEIQAELLLALDPARAATLVSRLETADRKRAIAALPDRAAREIAQLSSYPAGTAGQLMDARVTAFAADTTVGAAIEQIRGIRQRRIADVMVVDEDGRLDGLVPLQDLVGAAPDHTLGDLVRRDVVFVQPMTRREDVVDLLNQHKLSSLPVVDLAGRLVGVLRYAALVDAAQQNAAGDLQSMVGASREERALSSPWLAVRTRLPWLNVNLLTAFAASAVIGLFENTIARFTALAVLLPVVAGQSGNTGAQAMAVTMRGLALREIRASHWWLVAKKELLVGVVNGVAIALVTAVGVFLWSRNLALSGVIAAAMVVSMGTASLAGASIPVGLVALDRDPATASSIVLTTVTDIVGFFTFLGLASIFASFLGG